MRVDSVFLTTRWDDLAMASYEVDPALLRPHAPPGTELDDWDGRSILSVVGVRFSGTRVFGVPIPWHRDFDEVNFRFYVRRRVGSETRRAVVFLQEIVRRRAVAWVARLAYSEKYVVHPLERRIDPWDGRSEAPRRVSYRWRPGAAWCGLELTIAGAPRTIEEGSLEAFVAERLWGYVGARGGGTIEYRVAHPRWRAWRATDARLEGDPTSQVGAALAPFLRRFPISAFFSDGSDVTIYRGARLP